ncbi:MAG: DNA cytosine methyltransferase [Elusimicrobiota bacterium]
MPGNELTCSELFCGAGGLSEGFQRAGFSILSAVDFDEHAVATMRATHPKTNVYHQKIEDISAKDLLKGSGLRKSELDVLSGGPPCQAFSVYNHQRGFQDERSGLFRQYLRIVEEIQPKLIVMENVAGILSLDEGRAVLEIHKKLKELGYVVEHRILKAEEYGVPQERRRVFFMGNRLGLPIVWPEVTHGEAAGRLPFVTVWDAIGDLPPLKILGGAEEQGYRAGPNSSYQSLMRIGSSRLHNHVAPHLAPINVERMKHILPGGSWRDIPVRLLPAGMKRARRSDHTKRYGRLAKTGLASTILTKCDIHWGAYIHPSQDRSLTVREAARLQSFPDRFRFSGPRFEQFRQVGNAVPPLLAEAVARSIAKELKKLKFSRRELTNVG